MELQNCLVLDNKKLRDAYKIFACNGILFNHESPIRGETFVTEKLPWKLLNTTSLKSLICS